MQQYCVSWTRSPRRPTLHDVVQHFDHVLHHPSSAAIKEHVPATCSCMVARATWYDGSHCYKDTKNGPELVCYILLSSEKIPSKKKREIKFGNLGFRNRLQWLEVSRLFLVFSVLIHVANSLESNIACKTSFTFGIKASKSCLCFVLFLNEKSCFMISW